MFFPEERASEFNRELRTQVQLELCCGFPRGDFNLDLHARIGEPGGDHHRGRAYFGR